MIKNLSKEEKDKIKQYQRKRFQKLIQYKKEALQNNRVLFLLSIRMSEKTLKFDNIKKEFHRSKQPINLDLVNVDQIVISDRFKRSDDSFKYLLATEKVKLVNRYVLSYIE